MKTCPRCEGEIGPDALFVTVTSDGRVWHDDCVTDGYEEDGPELDWLTETLRAGHGHVEMTINENGDLLVLWWNGERRHAIGNTAWEALHNAMVTDRQRAEGPMSSPGNDL